MAAIVYQAAPSEIITFYAFLSKGLKIGQRNSAIYKFERVR